MTRPNDGEQEFAQAQKLLATRRISAKMPSPIGKFASRVLSKHAVASEQAVNQVEQAWEQVTQGAWKQVTRVGLLKRGKLEVLVANSMINQQLTWEKKRILAGMQQALPSTTISEIVFRIGAVG